MKSTKELKNTRLEPYMEVVGLFVQLWAQNGVLLAEIANRVVVLPVDMEEALLPHVGSWISILRTDIPGKEYLFRVIADKEKTSLICEKARAPESCEASA